MLEHEDVIAVHKVFEVKSSVCGRAANATSKKETLGECMGCAEVVPRDGKAIVCMQSHAICQSCSGTYINNILENPEYNLPPKCPICSLELNVKVSPHVAPSARPDLTHLQTIERCLNPSQLERFENLMLVYVFATTLTTEDEKLFRCPFCPYFEIRAMSDGAMFMRCQAVNCMKASCTTCKLEVPQLDANYQHRRQSARKLGEIEKHYACAQMSVQKHKVERALEMGLNVPCPSCGISGMKDDNCTHMRCLNCNEFWCYFCGKREQDLNKSSTSHGIWAHNVGWPNRLGERCPMYLSQLHETHDWPTDEDACLAMYHRIRTASFLKQVMDELGSEACEQLDEQFSIFKASGFSFQEIQELSSNRLSSILTHGSKVE
ncbi:hypothetical protein GUITHDRAFT_109229 [Guillardia theta CCMP2712]|uniref:RING-type domain-containing protein n=1 Tax=Guillardia theta (strain CCMP2712) TaxID=905079 RepID=L1J8G3_GUITC|nr:hypothetical protein GUITHDRAFT_109229 [Guillardia theta CCMP2712]EKX44801.1 hypothetical protein GUITHDRAFT_109229 [Guillardia theta CCMP2712]|eukprot:XP_005831781.1 hypothetical protein GUITHDRAFT_109229 [Guillardia theta CCMP2712]